VRRSSEIDSSPAFMTVWNRVGVVVDAVVVLIEEIDGGVDECRLDERGARRMSGRLLVEIANDRSAAGDQRVRHGCATHVLVVRIERESPSIVLIRAVLRVGECIVLLLASLGIA